jgi:uncharacterized membrane protein
LYGRRRTGGWLIQRTSVIKNERQRRIGVRLSSVQANQTPYNEIAGQSVERLAAISDGIFAVAMTLQVLDLHGPAREAIHSEEDLWHAFSVTVPQFITYLMSFLTLAIFWNGQQTQLNLLAQTNRHLTWIHMAFLFAVSVMPFSTRYLAEFIGFRTTLLCYWANILLLGVVLYFSWLYASRAGLIKDNTPDEVRNAIQRRILRAQALYALGAALCIVNTYASIAFNVLVQLNFAVAPRIRWLSRI